MAAKGLVLYLLAAFSLAVLSVHLVNDLAESDDSSVLKQSYGAEEKVWPELEFNWRVVVATVIGFLGSAFGTVGGVGGGGLFLPMLTLIVGFDTKSAAAISKCMIMGATVSSVWFNLTVPHPCRQVPIIDYDLALLFQPMLMLGITIGVPLSVVFPYWLITVLIIVLFMATSSRSFMKAIAMWKQETVMNHKMAADPDYQPLLPQQEKTPWESIKSNLDTKRFLMLSVVWIFFILLQIIKKHTEICGEVYWGLTFLQLPAAFAVLGYECVKIYRENRRRKREGSQERICEATIEWNATSIMLCALCGLLGGTVGGLLGSGAGFILGPFLLEIGLIPQVASATAAFSMMFSATLSVLEFYLLKRFPIDFGAYMMFVAILAGFGGQYLIKKLVDFLGRASIIVFTLSGFIFASAVIMGAIGIVRSVGMIRRHEFMGFLDFCSNQ